jgi:hypothetical protein
VSCVRGSGGPKNDPFSDTATCPMGIENEDENENQNRKMIKMRIRMTIRTGVGVGGR